MTYTTITQLSSGECRWIGREDIHVYCHAPARREPRYSVVCPEAGLDYGTWETAEEAAARCDRILAAFAKG